MRAWVRSDGQSACPEPSNMCKVNTDFNPTAITTTVSVNGADITLTCDGTYGVAPQALKVIQLATSKPSAEWSDFTCADMSTNVTAHFIREYSHKLYLKDTMKEFVEAYGAVCCGSLGKARDPCGVSLSAPAHAKSDCGRVLDVQHASSNCLLSIVSGGSDHHLSACCPIACCPSSHGHEALCGHDRNDALQVCIGSGLHRCPMQASWRVPLADPLRNAVP